MTSKIDDQYKLLACELLDLADAWKKARWWEKNSIAHVIALKVWSRSDQLQSALLYHKVGMNAIRNGTPLIAGQREEQT